MNLGRLKQQPLAQGAYDYHDEYSTPAREFDPLMEEFGFICDLAANADNHKLDSWLGAGGLAPDSLEIPWHQLSHDDWLWLNSPFNTQLLLKFVERCSVESSKGARIVAILPAHRTEQFWWQRYVLHAAHEIRSIKGRTKYDLKGRALDAWLAEEQERARRKGRKAKIRPDAPNFPSCIAVFDGKQKYVRTVIKSWDPDEGYIAL